MSKFKLFGLAALIVGFAAACAHTGRVAESTKSVVGINEMTKQLNLSQAEVEKVIVAMDELAVAHDLQMAFKNYTKSVNSVQAARRRDKAQRDSLQANNRQYMAKWQMELETIQDEDVKAALEQRKEKVIASFENIRSVLDDLREAYQPLLTNVLEIRKALALDLNSLGVQSLASSMNKAKGQAEVVKQKIAKARQELDQLADSLSPTAEMK
ncbi:MAG: hypothetical protein H6753_01375 [Candidatus Omnitrophica bacterium]|nr:hypothetical protein [Candidatus Omnitrophota bacterium]